MKVFCLVFRQNTWDGGDKRLIANKRSERAATKLRDKTAKKMDSISYIEIWTQPELPLTEATADEQQ